MTVALGRRERPERRWLLCAADGGREGPRRARRRKQASPTDPTRCARPAENIEDKRVYLVELDEPDGEMSIGIVESG